MAIVRGFNAHVEGLAELEAQFARIGKMPKKYLTKAAREGIAPVLAQAKANAPIGETGILQKSISIKMETPNKRNKGVYFLRFSPKYTDYFLKETTGVYGGKTPYAYYPHSVEYGYLSAKGHIPGQHFMNWAISVNENKSLGIVVKNLNKAIDELTR